MALVGLLLAGPRWWPAVFAGVLAARLATGAEPDPVALATIAAGDAAGAALGALLLQRLGLSTDLRRARDALALTAAGGAGTALVGASVTAVVLHLSGGLVPGTFGAAWLDAFLADLAGVLVVAPTLLTWRRAPRAWPRVLRLQAIACLAVAAALAWAVFVLMPAGMPLAWYTLLPLVWAAMAFRARGAPAVLVVAAIAIWGTTHGQGPFGAGGGGPLGFTLLQQFLSVAALTTMLLGALVDERDAQRARRIAEDRLRLTLAGVRAGTWELDLDSGRAIWSPETEAILGVSSPDRHHRFDDFVRLIHPDDRATAIGQFERACARGGPFEQAFRIRRADDGAELWLSSVGRVELDGHGRARRVTGINQDITARKQAEAALLDSEARSRAQLQVLDTVYQTAPVGLWLMDRELRYQRINQVLADFNGRPVDAHLGRTLHEMVPQLADAIAPRLKRLFDSGEPIVGFEVEGTTAAAPDTVRSWVGSCYPLRDAAGVVTAVSGVVVEITETKRTQAALLDADRRKDEYLATLAHELRNPLAPIRTGLQVLARTAADSPAAVDARAMMTRQLRHMVRLIDGLLDVSRISRGQVELRQAPVAVATIVAEAVEASRPAIDEQQHALAVDVGDEPLAVFGDAARLVQVVGNLLHNAARYTPAGGHVALDVYRSGDHVVIRVDDDGPGIPAPMLERVFDLFTQVDTTRGGLGIGLSLVRQLVHLHGGTVRAESPGTLGGSTFTVRLPLSTGTGPTG